MILILLIALAKFLFNNLTSKLRIIRLINSLYGISHDYLVHFKAVVNQVSRRIVLHSHVEDNLFVDMCKDIQHDFNFKISNDLQISTYRKKN